MTKKKLYSVDAQYKAYVELVVAVEEGEDPNDPNNWDIIEEYQSDYSLYDNEPPVDLDEQIDEEET